MFGAGIPPAVPAVAGNGPERVVVLGILVLVTACLTIAMLIRRRGERAKVTRLVQRPEAGKQPDDSHEVGRATASGSGESRIGQRGSTRGLTTQPDTSVSLSALGRPGSSLAERGSTTLVPCLEETPETEIDS